MQCSFRGCEKDAFCKGFCRGHYRQHKAGEVLRTLQIQYHGLNEYQRFMKRVVVSGPDECWNWTGSQNNSHWHGQWRNSAGEVELTHRAAWRLMKGDIPKDGCILHRCDNPLCVNTKHLFLGSQSDNAADMWKKGRARPGKSVGEKHGMSKLNESVVRQIRASDETGAALAVRFGVSQTTICDIRKRRIWKHLGD